MFAREASRGTLLTVLLLLGIPPLLEAQDYADASRPLWSGGSNKEGAMGATVNLRTSNYNSQPTQILGYGAAGRRYEVISVATGQSHVVALATLDGKTSRDEPRRAFVWGSNSMGQIGEPESPEPAAVRPRRLLRSLFPLLPQGNVIDSTNRKVCYRRWNTSVVPAWNHPRQEILLTTGVRGIKDIERDINSHLDDDYISIETDVDTEMVNVHLLKSGVQFDFASPSCTGLASRLGFARPFFKLPPVGLLNEVSDSSGLNNNILLLRQWNPIYFSKPSYLLFRGWSSTHQSSVLYNISISIFLSNGRTLRGPRGPLDFMSELNREAAQQGHPSDLFDFGTSEFPSPITLTMKYPGYHFLFEESFAGWQTPPVDVLGVKNMPPTGTFYAGRRNNAVPNEVSFNAGTHQFEYRYMSSSTSSSTHYTITLPSGVRTLEEVLRDIRAGFDSNDHDADTIRLFADAEGIVHLQIRRAGFQVMFSANHSIANYLGFELKNFPCNPFTETCHESEVVDAACVNATTAATANVTSAGPEPQVYCGVTQGTDIFHKRGHVPRMYTSRFTASGQCTRQDNSAGKCACLAANASATMAKDLCAAVGVGLISRLSITAKDEANDGECSCTIQSYFLRTQGYRTWGVFTEHPVTFNDNIYDVNSLNMVLSVTLSAKGFDPQTLRFMEEGTRLRMVLGIYTTPVINSRLQVDFNSSTISGLLGFERIAQPPGYTSVDGATFEHAGESNSTLVSGSRVSATANSTGEPIVSVAAGQEHTLIQTCVGGDRVAGHFCRYTRLWALGSNKYGQLGTDHQFLNISRNSVPVLVNSTSNLHAISNFDPENARSIHAGGGHSAVVDVNGKMWTFGDNRYGQRGDVNGSIFPDWEPRQIEMPAVRNMLRNATLALGLHHTLVMGLDLNMTRIWAFGRNQHGQLARPASASQGIPQLVQLPNANFIGPVTDSFTSVCAGSSHSVFQTTDGRLWAVGRNTFGQLGIFDSISNPEPSAGQQQPLGSIKIEGGNGDVEEVYVTSPLPVGSKRNAAGVWSWIDVFGGSVVDSFRCGYDHTVVVSGHKLLTFGSNVFGQLLQETNAGLSNKNDIPVVVDADLFLGDAEAESPQLILDAWASGDSTFVQTLRQPCTPGHVSPDGHQPCFDCQPGKFEPGTMSTGCINCPLGRYSKAGQIVCAICPAGKYANTTGMPECLTCPSSRPGTFGEGAELQSNCTKFCESGTFGTFGTPPCSKCGPGTYSVTTLGAGPDSCTLCERGTYQSLNETSSCANCAVGFSTPGQGSKSVDDCLLVCLAGTYGADGLANCTQCVPGTVAPVKDMSRCDLCGNGTYMNISGQAVCYSCPPGKGTTGEGKTSIQDCIPLCQPGNFSDTGVEPCQSCPAGLYSSDPGQRFCDACGPGKFSSPGQSVCQLCQAGFFVAGTGNPSCLACKAGQFQDSQGQTQCKACITGEYSNTSGMSACYHCPGELTTIPPTGNMGANSSTDCQRYCRPGTISSDGLVPFGLLACTQCQDGYSTTQDVNGTKIWGATTCLPCLAGAFAPQGAEICLRCPPGTFSNSSDAPCGPCRPGYTSFAGATVCQQCTPGSFSNAFGRPNCSQCLPGSYQNSTASTVCVLCSAGYHSPLPSRQVPCVACFAGKYTGGTGASLCISCAPGYFSSSSDTVCSACSPGSFTSSSLSATCTPCENGKFADGYNSTVCKNCDPGYAAPTGSDLCTACLTGTYSSGALATCAACPTGQYTRSNRSVSIDQCMRICRPGQFGNQGLSRLGNESCPPCAVSYYSDQQYATVCSACESGKFAAVNGSSGCTNCSEGTYSANASSSCMLCSTGKFDDTPGASICRNCNPGKFTSSTGSTYCTHCSLGKYQDLAGTSVCKTCELGKSTPLPGASSQNECQSFCLKGFYGVENGVERPPESPCRPCAPGSYNPFMKMTSCFKCPVGKFASSPHSTACLDCEVNSFSVRSNSSSCQPCEVTVFGDPTYTIGTSDLPYWMIKGATKGLECRTTEDPCGLNPRNLSVYPIYVGGRDDYGQTGSSNMISTGSAEYGDFNYNVRQTIFPCKAFGGIDISRFRTGGFHSMVETGRVTDILNGKLKIDRALWTFGSNSHGQLGVSINVGTIKRNSIPNLVPRYLFPAMTSANEISAGQGNNVFVYWFFDSDLEKRVQFNVTLVDGHYSPLDIAKYVSLEATRLFQHPNDIFSVEPDPTGQRAIFMVARPGFQADFTSSNSPRENFGISSSKIPRNGTLNEISAEAGNNIFTYRYWCGTWLEGTCNQSRTVRVTLPDGIYTLDKLQAEIEMATLHNGDDESRFVFTLDDGLVSLRVDTQFQIAFEGKSLASFLGFDVDAVPTGGPLNETRVFKGQQRRPWLWALGTRETSLPATGLSTGQMISDFFLGANHSLVQTWEATNVPGNNHTLSRLWAFGSNNRGQLGVQNNAGTHNSNHVPIVISTFDEMNGGRRAVRFTTGAAHTMVLDSSGKLWLFGSNEFGQLGVAANSGNNTPTWQPFLFDVEGLHPNSKVHDFEAGDVHSVVMSIDDMGEQKLWLFGSNQFGQLGKSSNAGICKDPQNAGRTILCDLIIRKGERFAVANWKPTQLDPVTLGNSRLYSFHVGSFHNIIRTFDGRLWCFGSNEFGQCGFDVNAQTNNLGTSINYQPLLLGSQENLNDRTQVVSPPAACCMPGVVWNASLAALCPSAGHWWDAYGVSSPCPFHLQDVQIVEVGDYHTMVVTGEPPPYEFQTYWTYGLNDKGQLLRKSDNLGTNNPNEKVEVLPATNFGTGKEIRIGQSLGGDQSFIMTVRLYCEPGNHSIDKREPCSRCEPGSFSSFFGSLTGKFYSFDQSVEHPHTRLVPLVYKSNAHYLSCEPCPAGNFSVTYGQIVCGGCGVGTYSFPGASICHDCAAGTYANNTLSANCTLCETGYSSNAGAEFCYQCFRGKYANSKGMPACLNCGLGEFNPNLGSSFCSKCAVDYYQNETGASTCTQCPLDRRATALPGSTSIDDCLSLCPPGQIGTPLPGGLLSVLPCKSCRPGFFAPNRGMTACLSCAGGSFTYFNASSNCIACPGGRYSRMAATVCLDCPQGTFSSSHASSCTLCPVGTYSLGGGNVTACSNCTSGFSQNTTGQTFCNACTSGKASNPGSETCDSCQPGTYSQFQASSCSSCAKGYFSGSIGLSSCGACAPGTYSEYQASSCIECSPGLYAFGPFMGYSATVCENCPSGKFSGKNATANCTLCPPGSFNEIDGKSVCDLCAPGYHTSSTGYTACAACIPGTFSLTNSSHCQNCSLGTFNNIFAQQNCTECASGYFGPRTGLTVCFACAGGTYGNVTGLSGCYNCKSGVVSTTNATVCSLCIPGTIAPASRMTACVLCSVGYFNDQFSATGCTSCVDYHGKQLSTQGAGAGLLGRPAAVPEWYNAPERCVPECREGEFSIWGFKPIYDNCTKCPPGFFNPNNGSTHCLSCAAGHYSSSGLSACLTCGPGTYSRTSSARCTSCASGQFQWQSGQSACLACPGGMFSRSAGRTVCEHCPTEIRTSYVFYTDCRVACSSRDLVIANVTPPVCCQDVAVSKAKLRSGKYYLKELEAEINYQILNKSAINDVVRLERDYLAISRELSVNETSIKVNIQYGGFVFHFYDPENPTGYCKDEFDRWKEERDLDPGMAIEPPELCTQDNVATKLGFSSVVPALGATRCHFSGQEPRIDGGCYSTFSLSAPASPDTLITKFAGENSSTACRAFCGKGTYSFDGIEVEGRPCSECKSGNYSDEIGSTACKECEPGGFSANERPYPICTDCEKGKSQLLYAQTACNYCNVGKFSPFLGGVVCVNCQPGTYSLTTGAAASLGSSAGFILLSPVNNASNLINAMPDTCLECPPGQVSAQESSTACNSCLSGSAAMGTGFTSCSYCHPGYFSQSNGASVCTQCLPGSRSKHPSSSTSCIWCHAGTASPGPSSVCKDCVPGKFSKDRAPFCSSCAPGFHSVNYAETVCQSCVPGKISVGNQQFCDNCPLGTYINASNSSACLNCTAGTFSGTPGSSTCLLCDHGKYSSTRASACTLCPPGHNTTAKAKTQVNDCIRQCEPGFSGFNGVLPCYRCRPGGNGFMLGTLCRTDSEVTAYWTNDGLSELYIVDGKCLNNTCPLCVAGKYSPRPGMSTCYDCAQHTYSNAGQGNCTACPGVSVTSRTGSASLQECQAKCTPGAYSFDGLSPCLRCGMGTYGRLFGMTVCDQCLPGKFQPIMMSTSCFFCPPGKSTFVPASSQASFCQGIAPKYYYNDEAMHPECRPDYSVHRDEGVLNQVRINDGGDGYIAGYVVMLGGPGVGFESEFDVDVNGSVITATITSAGRSYTSSARVEVYYPKIKTSVNQQPNIPPGLGGPGILQPVVQRADVVSNKSMTGTITRVFGYPFLDLMRTPESVLVGCEAGHIEADSVSGGSEFRAEYSVNQFENVFEKLCIGYLDDTGSCHQQLDKHGINYMSRPKMRIVETAIKSVKVLSGPGSSIRGCNLTNSTLKAYGGGVRNTGFEASYSVFVGNGSIYNPQIVARGRGYESPPSIYPEDSKCICGSGIGKVNIVNGGSGYRGTYSNDTAGFLVMGHNSQSNPGTEFKATFGTDSAGHVSHIEVLDAGSGYTGDEVQLMACPLSCCAMFEESCCFNTPSSAPCRHGIVAEAVIIAEIGFRGGEPGHNFDRCLQAEIDRSSCLCGSSIEEIQRVDAGAGYVNGSLQAYEILPSECFNSCIEPTPTNATNVNGTNMTSVNGTNVTSVSNATNVTNCPIFRPPHYCNISGTGFAGSFHVAPTQMCPDDASMGSNISRCVNSSVARGLSGGISVINFVTRGLGYNKSNLAYRMIYAEETRCDDGTGNSSTSCPQTNTITEIVVQGNSSFVLPTYYSLVANESKCSSSCEGVPHCTGVGFSARLAFGNITRISGKYDPMIQMATITRAEITNHGTGYDAAFLPRIQCSVQAVFNVPIAAPDRICYAFNNDTSGTNGTNWTVVNCTYNLTDVPKTTDVNRTNSSNSSTVPGPWDLFRKKIGVDLETLTWRMPSHDEMQRQNLLPSVASGGLIDMRVGKRSDDFGMSDACLDTFWANSVALGAGPLIDMEVRLFGAFLTANQTEPAHFDRIVLDEYGLNNERLLFFVKAAFGSESVEFRDCMCHLQTVVKRNDLDNVDIHRGIECVCMSDLWGLEAKTSLFLIEASNSTDSNATHYPSQARVDLAILKVATAFSGVWKPFMTGGIPLFGETPASSWVHTLAFGKSTSPSSFDLYIKASTATFNYSMCVLCNSLTKSDQVVAGGVLQGIFSQGLQFRGGLAHLVPRPDGRFHFLGMERMFSEIRSGTQLFNVEAHLSILDCLWHETQQMEWKLAFNATIPFHPAGSLVVADTVNAKLTGIREHEDLDLDIPLTVYLEENHPFNVTSKFKFLRKDVTKETAPFNAIANSSEWDVAFNLKWLLFNEANFVIEGVQLRHMFGINVTHFTFNGSGLASFVNDPWTSRGEYAQVAIDFRGTSGRQFPHVSSEVKAYLTTSDPAAVVRTLMQQALRLNFSNPTCGTTACQDLLFVQEQVRIVLSTWDSQDVGFAVPSRDARSYSCITTNGNVPSGSPCHFPFEYNGQIFTECTSQDWHTSWCSTTPVYSGQWGECVCDKLRRGVQLTGQVGFYEEGPLLTLNADGVQQLVDGVDGSLGLAGVNGTLKMYFPIFDSDASNDLEMLVMIVPRDASRCVGGNNSYAPPKVGTAPSGECERLGYITEWLGEPGDESMVVCKHPDEVFSSDISISTQFVAAATQANLLGMATRESNSYTRLTLVSSLSPVDEAQACMDVGLAKEMSLCTAEKFRNIPVAAPELFGHQFCFWTDTSRNPGLEENKFAQCAVCHGPSCTANHEPLRAWQLEDRVCYSFPCV